MEPFIAEIIAAVETETADYTVWRDNLNFVDVEETRDGTVDATDFTIWRDTGDACQ